MSRLPWIYYDIKPNGQTVDLTGEPVDIPDEMEIDGETYVHIKPDGKTYDPPSGWTYYVANYVKKSIQKEGQYMDSVNNGDKNKVLDFLLSNAEEIQSQLSIYNTSRSEATARFIDVLLQVQESNMALYKLLNTEVK